MKQQESTKHINPAQLKLAHTSPAKAAKMLSVLTDSNRLPVQDRPKMDNPPSKPDQAPRGLPPKQANSVAASVPTTLPNYFVRTNDSNFFSNTVSSVVSGPVGRAISPSKNQGSVLIMDPRVSAIRGSTLATLSHPPAEGEKKSILYMNMVAAQQPTQLQPDSNPLMKSSLQQLYEEVYALREKASAYEQKERTLTQRESKLQEKENSIASQLDQQKLIFEEYNCRIKALHQSMENYERRQKDLLLQLGEKEEVIGTLQSNGNRLRIELTEAVARSSLLESQAAKASAKLHEEGMRMLAMLGYQGPVEECGILKVLSAQTEILVCQDRQLKVRCVELEASLRKREEELQRAKEKVTGLVGSCYSQISKLSSEAGELHSVVNKLTAEKEETARVKQQQITHLDCKLSEVASDRETLKSELGQLSQKLQTLQQERRVLDDKLRLASKALSAEGCSCGTIRNILSQNGQGVPQSGSGGESERLQELLGSIFESLSWS